MKGHSEGIAHLLGQGVQALPALRFPHPHRPIALTTDQHPPIRTESNRIDQARIAAQRPETLTSFTPLVDLPQLHDTILAATGQQPRGTKDGRPDPFAMALQRTQTPGAFTSGSDPPQFHATIATATGQQPLRIEGRGEDYVRVPAEGAQLLATAGLPHHERSI